MTHRFMGGSISVDACGLIQSVVIVEEEYDEMPQHSTLQQGTLQQGIPRKHARTLARLNAHRGQMLNKLTHFITLTKNRIGVHNCTIGTPKPTVSLFRQELTRFQGMTFKIFGENHCIY